MQRRTFLSTTLGATSALTAANTPFVSSAYVVKAGAGRFGEKTKLFGVAPSDIKVSVNDTGGLLSVLEYWGGKGGPPLHVHPNQDEVFYVLEGDYLFQVGDERHRLSAGDLIFLPRNVPHTFAQVNDVGRMLFFFQPGGKMEDYFRALGRLTANPTPAEGARLFADHDMRVVGPPLAVE